MNDLEKKIAKWLSEQGYPLEMKVSRAFRKAGFRTIQSDYFHDPETEREREIDLVASVDRKVDDLLVRIEFVIECKQSTSKPWLLFTSPDNRLADPARVAQRLGSSVARCALDELCQTASVQRNNLFTFAGPTAYGATQAFTSGKDVAFEAMASVSAAALAKAREIDSCKHDQFRIAKFVFPLIVVESKIFGCQLDEGGEELEINQIREGTVIWRSQRAREPHTIIPVVALDGVDEYIQRISNASRSFLADNSDGFLKALELAKEHLGPKFLLA
jgi:hypothetical protein